MGWLSPKYPTPDTPGASAGPAPRPARQSRRRNDAPSAPAPSSRNQRAAEEMTGIASAAGGRIERIGGCVQATVDTRSMGRSDVNKLRRLVKDNGGSFEDGPGYVQITMAAN